MQMSNRCKVYKGELTMEIPEWVARAVCFYKDNYAFELIPIPLSHRYISAYVFKLQDSMIYEIDYLPMQDTLSYAMDVHGTTLKEFYSCFPESSVAVVEEFLRPYIVLAGL
jgi:hypothetical protein